jgi:hypothetical protein
MGADVNTVSGPRETEQRTLDPTELEVNEPSLKWLVPVMVLVALVLLWIVPTIGFVAAVGLFVWLLPLGTFFEGRVALLVVFATFYSCVTFEILGLSVSGATLRWTLAVLLLGCAASSFVRPGAVAKPRWTWATTFWLAATLGVFASITFPVWGSTPGELLAVLQVGWDHSSHFAFFAEVHEQQVTNFVTESGDPGFGAGYPAADVFLWSAVLSLLSGGVGYSNGQELLMPYVVFSAATVALALGSMIAVAADSARLIAGKGVRRLAAAAGALTSGIIFLAGDAALSWTAGHVNYLLALSVVVAGGWFGYRFVRAERNWLGLGALAAAGVASLVIYPPVALTLVPVGGWVLVRVVGRRPLVWCALAVGLAVVGILALNRLGTSPDQLLATIDQLALMTGGHPSFDQLILFVAPLIAFLLGRHALSSAGIGAAVAVVGGLVGMSAVAGWFTWRALVQGQALVSPSGYYPIKLWYGAMLIALILVSVVFAIGFASYVRRFSRSGQALSGLWSLVAWIGLVSVLVWVVGYFGPASDRLPVGRIAPGLAAIQEREGSRQANLSVANLLIAADDAAAEGAGPLILWGPVGDLKVNHWLMGLHGGVDGEVRALITQTGPPSDASVAAFEAYLAASPDNKIQIAYYEEQSARALSKLQKQYPDQMLLVPLV